MAANRKHPHLHDAKTRRALLEPNLIEDVHDYRVNRHTFSIYVGGDPSIYGNCDNEIHAEPGVEHHMADRFDINLNLLSDIDPNRPILVTLASCGGNWYEGMQMFGAILTCPNPVTVVATKWARSMSSIIPLAADRFLLRPPARYMFHHGTNGYSGQSGEEFTTFVEEHEVSKRTMLDIYVNRLKSQGAFKHKPAEDIYEMLSDKMRRKVDVWLSAKDAVWWGFADGIYTGDVSNLRATKVNDSRRKTMLSAIN